MVPSRVVGRYALFETLGSGGSASVWLGVEQNTSVPRALKRLHDSQRNPQAVARLFDEVRLVKHVIHPNVVQVIELVSDGAEMLAVMEYIHGEPLSRLKDGPVPLAIATAVTIDFLSGLGAAHGARDADGVLLGLVHRDVTPDNILVGEDGHARLTDFGVAKATGRLQDTKNGGVRGKLAYLAPEQVGGDVTAQTDVYAAGLVLWEMLTGEQAIQGDNEAAMLGQALAPKIRRPGVSIPLDSVVMKALAVNPADRYETAEAFAKALAGVVPPADPRVVSEWVRKNAGETLDRRARIVASMVTPSSRQAVAEAVPAKPSTPSLWGSHKIGVALMGAVAMCVFAFFGKWAVDTTAPPPPTTIFVETTAKPIEAISSAGPSASASASVATTTRPPVTRSRLPKPTPNGSGAPTKCNPPWLIDSQGIRRYDPACM